MAIISRDDLERLAERRTDWCVSIYMPTHRTSQQIQQDPIRLKNLVSKAEKALKENGMRPAEVEDFLEPVRELEKDGIFWRHQSDGLALFLDREGREGYRLPMDFDPLSVVSTRFHLKPLLPLLSRDGEFYILALSQEGVKLYHGSQYSVNEVDVETLPEGIQSVLKFEDPELHVFWHTRTQTPGAPIGAPPTRPAEYHGQGADEQDEKELVLRYFQKVDKAISKWLGDEEAPLVLAGLGYLDAIYREANSYPHLVEEEIDVHPHDLEPGELHDRAQAILQPLFEEEREEATNQYKHLIGSGSERASHDIRQIVRAALRGRVGVLFVASDENQWGYYDEPANAFVIHKEREPEDEDLLDQAAVQTLLNDGKVYAMPREEMPEPNALVAAIFRY